MTRNKGSRLEMNQGCHKPLGHPDGLIMFSFNKKEYSCSTPEKSKAQAKSAEDVWTNGSLLYVSLCNGQKKTGFDWLSFLQLNKM